ncbi:hypothetical protein DAPPUDRAFT_244982 [Daphnia pulex]|uniref:Uncharacterized protein n=1 Tax=Daphnia pulex TaxID=6669 RepID=E9GMB9_DAPPU|nr:hypothetical protein DAPPUDRAFT_244982 [Daphnia pulex]|eukprot:EFX79417.1 hypothetical protein DAPPUDRAFT_244982 [Daphnia pulex]
MELQPSNPGLLCSHTPVQSHVLVPSIKLSKKTEVYLDLVMKLEVSRFGNDAVHHIQIPEAE